jgi:adenine-specific DNA methylase
MSVESIPFNKSFIESQFPVSKISKESYKERKSAQGQTLTQLGKWWGRKPLILVRAAVLGLLLPATDNPKKDREIFLKLLTMDDEGMWERKKTNISARELQEFLTPREKNNYLHDSKLCSGLSREEKNELQRIVFMRMGYDDRLKYCFRPEEIDGPSPIVWKEINEHLGTNASTIPELVEELGIRQFGSRPTVGDCFCGGGSVPFEAARIGCDVFGSDLNPVAALLTWASLNIVGADEEVVDEVKKAQQEVYDAVNKQITEWAIEHNEKGWRGYAYLYCNEVVCPECGWKIPLLPTLSIAERMQKVIAELESDAENKRYHIHIRKATPEESKVARASGTMTSKGMVCPNPECPGHQSPIPIASIRREHVGGLRLWENEDIVPRPDDVFQERLYCIRWMESIKDSSGREQIKWHFCEPNESDFMREEKVIGFLEERFSEWQEKGYLPNMEIDQGDETTRLNRERGWTRWHHLFTPRQLLYHGLLNESIQINDYDSRIKISMLIGLNRCNDWDSKLSPWDNSTDKPKNTFYNQTFNTLFSFPSRGLNLISNSWFYRILPTQIETNFEVNPIDGRILDCSSDLWITDPPYADAINYHELSDFFTSWYDNILKSTIDNWYSDSKKTLAIKGIDDDFRKSMVEVYRNLTNHMPDNGAQIVMFTHQDANVWADLAMILWAAGLQVTSAWCISTETTSGLKVGNYVQGTVLLVLRKQTSNDVAFLDEIYPEVEEEVKKQLESMLEIDDKEDPNFGDTDYQLAAYAAALRVLTRYKQIEDIDIERELSRARGPGERNPLEGVIENAVKIACDYLVPAGIDSWVWKQLMPEERFYLKGLELESHGEYRTGAYQELARGFGIRAYKNLQQSKKANETRLKTASEFKDRDVGGEGFSSSLVRNILFAIRQTRQEEDTAAGKVWLREYPGYWEKRKEIIELLRYFAALGMNDSMEQWEEDSKAAKMLSVVVEQDHV